MRYIIIGNLMNDSLSFRAILTKVTFVIVSVASLMLDSTCFVIGLPLGTFILVHVSLKCHFETFVTLSRNSKIFYRNQTIWFVKPDHPVFADLLYHFFFWIVSDLMPFFFTSKVSSLR
jgi:hypothetical protein